ncbi:hypothetical protein [Ferrimonas balearica]|uniref:hypothetical protein n=1 Tax=Ferrimonas balearica TaxID=44012 RepID=UPI001C9909DB|nr:hypothetical protein [Ferrimonas balearica]MBY5993006.1 hypothetical protein [Ferrimonas balearica]
MKALTPVLGLLLWASGLNALANDALPCAQFEGPVAASAAEGLDAISEAPFDSAQPFQLHYRQRRCAPPTDSPKLGPWPPQQGDTRVIHQSQPQWRLRIAQVHTGQGWFTTEVDKFYTGPSPLE